jgi:hypothetical protein
VCDDVTALVIYLVHEPQSATERDAQVRVRSGPRLGWVVLLLCACRYARGECLHHRTWVLRLQAEGEEGRAWGKRRRGRVSEGSDDGGRGGGWRGGLEGAFGVLAKAWRGWMGGGQEAKAGRVHFTV